MGSNMTTNECDWFHQIRNFTEDKFCPAVFDGLNCWPPTPAGQTVHKQCSEVFRTSSLVSGETVSGSAFRTCSTDGNWIGGSYTNYSLCVQALEEVVKLKETKYKPPSILGACIPYVLAAGSLLSLVCLTGSLCIYAYLKSVHSDRLKILFQMMIALLIKTTLWGFMVITKAFPRIFSYRYLNWLCKVVLSFHYYTLLVSTSWMLVLAHYFNRKLAKGSIWLKSLRREYMVFSWVLPIFILSIWAGFMIFDSETICWSNHSKGKVFLIIAAPILAAFLTNLAYLCKISNAVMRRDHDNQNPNLLNQIRKAKTDLIILCPILGINNLLCVYNPGGDFEEYYMLFHAFFQSIQGTLVAVFCCFLCEDVQRALKQKLRRCYCNGRNCRQNRNNRLIRARPRKAHNTNHKVRFLGDKEEAGVFTIHIAR